MDWSRQIFAYCERGADPGFWAEPFNAISNAAFILAGLLALWAWSQAPRGRRGLTELSLILLVLVIGIGSFLFHTYATRWAVLADVMPITLFMIAYLGYALRRYGGLSWLPTGLALALFFASLHLAENIRCGGRPCLNGSVGYVPALAALILVGAWLAAKAHGAGRGLLVTAGIFLVSLTFRTLDREVCPMTALLGMRPVGTHFIWHMLNATLLYLLVRTALRHGARGEPAG